MNDDKSLLPESAIKNMETAEHRRKHLSKAEQLNIFRRDGWLCCWCKKPVIFAPVMKLLEIETRASGDNQPLAYYHAHWTRDGSPLLDELGGVLDHVEAFASGGPCDPENLVTSCAKCNGRKGAEPRGQWDQRQKRSSVKGKYGEPQNWDGLTALFAVLAGRNLEKLTLWRARLAESHQKPCPMTSKARVLVCRTRLRAASSG